MEIPRLLLKNFRSVLRRLKPDRTARLGPPWIVLRSGPQGLVVQTQDAEAALSVRHESLRPPEVLVLPTSALSELEGRADNVILEAGTDKVQARWTDGAVPRSADFDSTDLAKLPKFPKVPSSPVSNPPGFLVALDEAMRTTANDNHRYALAKVQVRGGTGQLVASDGRQALIQGGFKFGFSQDVLIPKVTAFGCRELPQEVLVQVGKNDKWFTVQVGAWSFFAKSLPAWLWAGLPQPRIPALHVGGDDGKTVRRSHDRKAGKAALHLVSAWATANRLTPLETVCT